VTFHSNEATPKTGRVLNPKRNTRFLGRGYKMEQNNDVELTSPPTSPQNQAGWNFIDYFIKDALRLFIKCGYISTVTPY
jgi:hypothetical protein